MNKLTTVRKPWYLGFSYGRALQNSAVKAWGGKQENWKAGQDALTVRAKANSEAQLGNNIKSYLGQYQGSTDGSGQESLFVADYKY